MGGVYVIYVMGIDRNGMDVARVGEGGPMDVMHVAFDALWTIS